MILNDGPGVFPSSHKFIKLFPIALYFIPYPFAENSTLANYIARPN
jgi:hypothetical protein